MKNAFYFILKALFVPFPVYSKSSFWSCRKNGLIRKISLSSKFMTSQPSLQIFDIQILPNISQSKSNQRRKFGQFIEYNKINMFL